MILNCLVLAGSSLLALKCNSYYETDSMVISVQGLAMPVRPAKVVLRSNPSSSLMYSIISNYSNRRQLMHLYSLTTASGYSSRHSILSQKNRLIQYQTSVSEFVYTQCFLTAYNTVNILQSDIPSGETIWRTQVRTKIGKFATITVHQDILVIVLTNNCVCCLSLRQMAASKGIVYTLDSNQIYSKLTTICGQVRNLKAMLLKQYFIGIFLSANTLILQELSSSKTTPLRIDLRDLGCTFNDTFACFEICRYVSDLQCSPYLIVGVVKITKQSGQVVTIVIDILWNTKEYTSFEVYRYRSITETQNSKVHICSLPYHRLALGVQNCIVICQREEFGWVTLCILPLGQSLEGIIGIKSPQETLKSLLVVSASSNLQRRVSLYDINALIKGLNYDSTVLNFDRSINGKYQGFAKLAETCSALFLQGAVYLIKPPILKLSRLIYKNTGDLYEETRQLQLLCGSNSQTSLQSLELLSFTRFKQIFDKESPQIKQCIQELFSAKALQQAVDSFCLSIGQIISKLKAPSYFCIKALLRQISLIVIYLFRFIRYVSREQSSLSSSFSVNLNNLLNQVRIIGNPQSALVDEPIVHSIIKKNFGAIRDNIMGMLTLFERIQQETISKEEFSQCYFKYYSIFSKFTFNEILRFFRDHTSLAERVALMMYCAGVHQDYKLWEICQKFLTELTALRKDYHPLICYLCNDMPLYFINKQHLNHCQYLLKKESEELQWLPSLKNADYAADKYLRQLGLDYLGSFAPHELEQYRYKADSMVVILPEQQLCAFSSREKGNTIDWRGKRYLVLTTTNIAQLCQAMDSKIVRQLDIDTQRNLASWSSQLELLNKIFIHQLKISNQDKLAIRRKNLEVQYDCLFLTNDIYEEIGHLLRPQHQKMLKEYEQAYQLSKPFYFSRLKHLAHSFHLQSYISFANKNGKQNLSKDNFLESIDLSEILSKEDSECQLQKFDMKKDIQDQDVACLKILLAKLWKLYESLEELSNYEFEVEEQLCFQQFGNIFIEIMARIHQTIERHTKITPQEYSKVMEINPLTKIRKDLLAGKKIQLKQRKQQKFQKQHAETLKNSLRLYLIDQCFKVTKSWIFSFEELIEEAALCQVPMSGRMAWVFRQSFQISTL